MDYNTGIAVVGGGAAGMSAAAAAAEKGARVMVIEANNAVGGNGLFPRGIFGADSAFQRRKLVFADPDEIFRRCMEYSHWKPDARILRALIAKSGDTIGWLTNMGVEFTDVIHHTPNQTPEMFHITAPPINTGLVVMNALKRRCAELGVEVLTRTRARKLLSDTDGGVGGVLCDGPDGEIRVEAKKVIVSTGGFAGNEELLKRFFPKYDPAVIKPAGAGMRHMGDGILMAEEAGADIEGSFAMETAAPKISGFAPINLLIGKPQSVWVNRHGRRFADESVVYDFTRASGACLRQPGGEVYIIFDENMKNRILDDGRDCVELIHIPLDAEDKLDDTLVQAQRDGALCKSDSISDIAGFIGCAAGVLDDEIEEYNSYCRSGRDALFAKPHNYLAELNPPYYAVRAGTDMIVTHGGIRVDGSFMALNKDYEPVGNLYIAGLDFGGTDADVYNMSMSGHSFGFAVNSGRMAGENAAEALLSV